MNIFIINAILRFCLEVLTTVLIITLGLTKFAVPNNLIIGIVLPIVFILTWYLFVAPKANHRLNSIFRIIIEIIIFTMATYLLKTKVSSNWGIYYAIFAFINTVLTHIGAYFGVKI